MGLVVLVMIRHRAVNARYKINISENIKESRFFSHLLLQPTNVAHRYGLRSGFSHSEF